MGEGGTEGEGYENSLPNANTLSGSIGTRNPKRSPAGAADHGLGGMIWQMDHTHCVTLSVA